MILAASLLAVSVSAPLPDAPAARPVVVQQKQRNFNRYDFALYSGVVAYRLGDYWTTERALGNGRHEVELPQSFVATKSGFMAYSLGGAALEITASIYLHKHGHAKLARLADSLSIAGGTATDIHNFATGGRR